MTHLEGRHSPYNESDVQELYFQQRLDHFRSDGFLFQQRYFYSDRYANRSTSNQTLALLCVGGEGPALDKSVLVNSVHCSGDMLEFAKSVHEEYQIHLFALEHRFYGKSFPDFGWYDSPVSNENLVYLSSRQALADIGRFVSHQSAILTRSNLAPPIWIAFGGSYPGMLAAWARLKLPHLIYAAISSSAPVQPALDFRAFNSHVARSLADPQVGGSESCLSIVRDGHAQLVQAILHNVSRHERIAEELSICKAASLRNRMNLQVLLGDGVVPLGATVQGNKPSCTKNLCSIQKICEGLENRTVSNTTEAAMEALVWLYQQFRDANDTCFDIEWNHQLEHLSDPYDYENGDRSWTWQTCTEFGFFQTCEVNSSCPFGQGFHPLEQDLMVCEQAFGIVPKLVAMNIQDTLEYYGGWKLQATRVLSMTGTVDPWSELALQKSANKKDRPVYHVPGASHHFWTHQVQETDSKEIQQAREIIIKTLRRWLDDFLTEEAARDRTSVVSSSRV